MVAAASGDYGKPRPHLVIQSDELTKTHSSVMLCPITSELSTYPYRVNLAADASTGLRQPSQVMTDKILTLRRERVKSVIGRADAQALQQISRVLIVLLGLAEGAGG